MATRTGKSGSNLGKPKGTVSVKRELLFEKTLDGQPKAQMVLLARKLALLGLTDAAIGEVFGVSERCINDWKKRWPAFGQALAAGKTQADASVVDGLHQLTQNRQLKRPSRSSPTVSLK